MSDFNTSYQYLRADGVPVAQPLFQAGGDGATPISALQLLFENIGVVDACALNAYWHSVLPQIAQRTIVGGGPFHVCYAATFQNCYFAVAIWSTPPAVNWMRWNPSQVLELRRFAIAEQAPKNTASRMMSWMVRDIRRLFPPVDVLISYQATDHHDGTIYRASGWRPGSAVANRPWTHSSPTRSRSNGGAIPQIKSDKIRWELNLRGLVEVQS